MSLAVRVSDNNTVNTDNLKVQLTRATLGTGRRAKSKLLSVVLVRADWEPGRTALTFF